MKLIAILSLAAIGIAAAPQGTSSACTTQGCKWNSGITFSGPFGGLNQASSTTCSISANDGSCCCNGSPGGTLCAVESNSCFVSVTYSFTYASYHTGPASLTAGVMGCGSYDSQSGVQSQSSPPPFHPPNRSWMPMTSTVTVWAQCSTCDFGCQQTVGGG